MFAQQALLAAEMPPAPHPLNTPCFLSSSLLPEVIGLAFNVVCIVLNPLKKGQTENVAQLTECLPSMHRAPSFIASTPEGSGSHSSPSIWAAGGSGVQGHQPYSEFAASLSYVRP